MWKQIVFVFVVFVTNVIQAITGFAGTMLAMPSSIILLGANQAKSILNVLGLLTCVWLTLQDIRHINRKEFAKITICMLAGMILGIFIYKASPIRFLLNVYAVFIILVAIWKIVYKKDIKLNGTAAVAILLAAGIIHGMFISGGALLVVYAASALKDKTEFRATLSPVWVILNGIMFISNLSDGYFTQGSVILILWCIIPIAVSIVIGNKIHDKINRSSFLKLTYLLLIISGVMLIV